MSINLMKWYYKRMVGSWNVKEMKTHTTANIHTLRISMHNRAENLAETHGMHEDEEYHIVEAKCKGCDCHVLVMSALKRDMTF